MGTIKALAQYRSLAEKLPRQIGTQAAYRLKTHFVKAQCVTLGKFQGLFFLSFLSDSHLFTPHLYRYFLTGLFSSLLAHTMATLLRTIKPEVGGAIRS
jgi:hypothetical protein